VGYHTKSELSINNNIGLNHNNNISGSSDPNTSRKLLLFTIAGPTELVIKRWQERPKTFPLLDQKGDLISSNRGRRARVNELESPRKVRSRSPLQSRWLGRSSSMP